MTLSLESGHDHLLFPSHKRNVPADRHSSEARCNDSRPKVQTVSELLDNDSIYESFEALSESMPPVILLPEKCLVLNQTFLYRSVFQKL